MFSPWWAHVRTALAVGGMTFAAAAIGSACLDYAGEEPEAGRCETRGADAGGDCGAGNATPPTGSGSGAP